jgi:hypothetical protein
MATPTVRRNDANHDRMFGGSMRDIATGSESTEQRLRCKLLYIYGEWFLDTDGGVPWWQPDGSDTKPIMGVSRDLRYAESVLKAAIVSVPGVKSLDAFLLNFNATTRKLAVSCTVTDDDGNPITIDDAGP